MSALVAKAPPAKQLLALDGMLFQSGKKTPLCGDPEELLPLLVSKLGKHPTPATLHLVARVKNDLGDLAGAVRDLEAALKQVGRPKTPQQLDLFASLTCSRSVVADNGGDARGAEDLFAAALQADGAAVRRHCRNRSEAYAQLGDRGGAVKALEKLVARGDAGDAAELATLELRLGDYDEAERLFREARRADPYLARAYAGGAEVLKRRVFGHGRSDRAPTIAADDTDARIIAVDECLELLRRDVKLVEHGAPVDVDRGVYVNRQAKLIEFLAGECDKWKRERQHGTFTCGIVFCACNDD